MNEEQKAVIKEGYSTLLFGQGNHKEVKDHKHFNKSLEETEEWLDEQEKKRKEKERKSHWYF